MCVSLWRKFKKEKNMIELTIFAILAIVAVCHMLWCDSSSFSSCTKQKKKKKKGNRRN